MAALTAGGLESTARDQPRSRIFEDFDGLRAVAALAIVLTHTGYASGTTFRQPVGPFLARAEAGVAIFFVISGFLLYRPFVAGHLGGDSGPRVTTFWWRRALRIFPAYWLALTVIWLVFEAAEIESVTDAVIFYGLLQIYDPGRILGGITQAWSLATEVAFYAFLPLYASVLRPTVGRALRAQLRIEFSGIAALFVASVAFRLWIFEVEDGLADHAWAWLPANLDLFALGMVLAVVSCRRDLRSPSARAPWQMPPAWAWWSAAALAYWAVSIPLDLPSDFTAEVTTLQRLLRQLLYGLTGFLLVAPAVLAPTARGRISAFLRSPPMVGLGAISYGIYLWHLDVMNEVLQALGARMLSAPFWSLLAWTLGVSVVVATVSYIVLERPILRLKSLRR